MKPENKKIIAIFGTRTYKEEVEKVLLFKDYIEKQTGVNYRLILQEPKNPYLYIQEFLDVVYSDVRAIFFSYSDYLLSAIGIVSKRIAANINKPLNLTIKDIGVYMINGDILFEIPPSRDYFSYSFLPFRAAGDFLDVETDKVDEVLFYNDYLPFEEAIEFIYNETDKLNEILLRRNYNANNKRDN